jgi:site-specific DNA-methyltransferase (adenine-specific)
MREETIKGDCLQIMSEFPKSFADLVLTDPPYNISRTNNFNTMGRSGIDFGEWDKNADIFSYIKLAFQVLKDNGSFIVFNAWKNLGDIVKVAEDVGFVTKDMIRLRKTNPMPRNRDRRYITDYECGIWFTMPKGGWTFNRQDANYQRPEFVCSIDKGLHPNQKPLKAIEDLIKIHSNENDLILDCFAGSGTVGIAARKLNRQFILIERDDYYFDVMSKRLYGNL